MLNLSSEAGPAGISKLVYEAILVERSARTRISPVHSTARPDRRIAPGGADSGGAAHGGEHREALVAGSRSPSPGVIAPSKSRAGQARILNSYPRTYYGETAHAARAPSCLLQTAMPSWISPRRADFSRRRTFSSATACNWVRERRAQDRRGSAGQRRDDREDTGRHHLINLDLAVRECS